MSDKVLVYTGVFGDGPSVDKPAVWITVDGKAFVACPNLCVEPLEFSEPDNLTCPRCKWRTTTEQARHVLVGILGHLVALYAMIGDCDPVENIRATYLGVEEEPSVQEISKRYLDTESANKALRKKIEEA